MNLDSQAAFFDTFIASGRISGRFAELPAGTVAAYRIDPITGQPDAYKQNDQPATQAQPLTLTGGVTLVDGRLQTNGVDGIVTTGWLAGTDASKPFDVFFTLQDAGPGTGNTSLAVFSVSAENDADCYAKVTLGSGPTGERPLTLYAFDKNAPGGLATALPPNVGTRGVHFFRLRIAPFARTLTLLHIGSGETASVTLPSYGWAQRLCLASGGAYRGLSGPLSGRTILGAEKFAEVGTVGMALVARHTLDTEILDAGAVLMGLALAPRVLKTVVGGSATTLKVTLRDATSAVSWTLVGPGTLSAKTGEEISYTPPGTAQNDTSAIITATGEGFSANTEVAIAAGLRPGTPPAPSSSEAFELVTVENWSASRFSGDAGTYAGELDAWTKRNNTFFYKMRQAPKSWSYTGPSVVQTLYDPGDNWPNSLRSSGKKLSFGANPILRGALQGQGKIIYFGAMTTKHPGFVDQAYEFLDRAINLLYAKGSVDSSGKNDGRLGWQYGSTAADGQWPGSKITSGSDAGKYSIDVGLIGSFPALESSLIGGAASLARLVWENRDVKTPKGYSAAEKIKLVQKWRVFYLLHHVPRWKAAKGVPTASNPTYTHRWFAHSDMAEADAAYQFAEIETSMFRNGYTNTVSIDMPDGFANQRIDLMPGTSAQAATHPEFVHSRWIFAHFLNPVRIRTAYGSDIRDSAMRALYGTTGCTYWDQSTVEKRFTANSGYNQVTWGGLMSLYLGGVISSHYQNQNQADAFMRGVAGGASVGCLAPDKVANSKTAYVFDNPKSSSESRSYLLNGQPNRAFGGLTSGDETDDAHEWDNELYGIFAAFDPGKRVAPVTLQLRNASGADANKAGGLVSLMFNEIAKAEKPNWANGG